MITQKKYLIALSTYLPFGPVRLELLFNYFGSYEKVWKLTKKELLEVNLSEKIVQGFIDHRKDFEIETYITRLSKYKIDCITKLDESYPDNLTDLTNAPVVLYLKGEITKNDNDAVAIVGSRKMTSYGKFVASKFASELAQMGVTIVSGLALGIDAVAHKASLEVGGRSIAVLASGLDTITPSANYFIAKKIIESKKGAIISEYPLGVPALRANFANRNRIISGLSKAVIVVEGLHKSGTLLTARAAAEQGRTVFAVPGQITSPMSEAPFYLLENGARMLTKTKDIVDELDLQLQVDKSAVSVVMPTDEIEKIIYNLLENESKHIDEIVRLTKIDTNEVASKLSMMELKGIVKNLGDGVYGVRK